MSGGATWPLFSDQEAKWEELMQRCQGQDIHLEIFIKAFVRRQIITKEDSSFLGRRFVENVHRRLQMLKHINRRNTLGELRAYLGCKYAKTF